MFPIEASKIYLSSIKLFTAFILCGELCGEEERGLSNGSGKLKCPDFKLFDWVHWAQPIIRFRIIKKTNILWFQLGTPFPLRLSKLFIHKMRDKAIYYWVLVSKRLLFFFEMHQINLSNGTICNWSSINNSSLLLILGCIIFIKLNRICFILLDFIMSGGRVKHKENIN